MYEFHELAMMFPPMLPAAFEAFKVDIKENGLNDPITLFEGKIIDGRNRYLACLEVGIEPTFIEYTGNNPYNYVISKNVQRRDLTPAQKVACAANEWNGQKKVTGRPGKSGTAGLSLNALEARWHVRHQNIEIAYELKHHENPDGPVAFQNMFTGELDMAGARAVLISIDAAAEAAEAAKAAEKVAEEAAQAAAEHAKMAEAAKAAAVEARAKAAAEAEAKEEARLKAEEEARAKAEAVKASFETGEDGLRHPTKTHEEAMKEAGLEVPENKADDAAKKQAAFDRWCDGIVDALNMLEDLGDRYLPQAELSDDQKAELKELLWKITFIAQEKSELL